MYEYMFIKVEFKKIRKDRTYYEAMINNLAQERWRLIQILTPGTAFDGSVDYYEFIMEREIQ
ncbi:DUF4177 domain-containing protein [Tissierella praeacuta]|uniref:DUF4177 domain-containing protein n=1 Tax=Tissierella praeacuta TaxID=43131 RepID=UPI003DA3D127